MTRRATLILIGLAWTMPAYAAVDAFRVDLIDNSAGGEKFAEFVINRILIDFTGQFTGAQALIELPPESILQRPPGDFYIYDPLTGFPVFPPNPGAGIYTFVNPGPPGGCAVDLHVCSEHRFDDSTIDTAWGASGGQTIMDQSNYLIMQLTLRNNVNGTAMFLAAAGGEPTTRQGFIQNGILSFVPFVPEPSAAVLALLAATGLGVARWPTRLRRRRS
jgi:hypothetical protein